MLSKRLNIMLYSSSTGEQIILPVNPEKIELRYAKEVESFNILNFGEVNLVGKRKPLFIKLAHFLPEDDSVFNTSASIMYKIDNTSNFSQYAYSSALVVEILKKWAVEKNTIRVVIDEEINIECIVGSFTETLRENTTSKPYILELFEFRSPKISDNNIYGLYSRKTVLSIPKTIVMKNDDTLYSIADKYGLDFKTLAQINNIKDVNASMPGTRLSTIGV